MAAAANQYLENLWHDKALERDPFDEPWITSTQDSVRYLVAVNRYKRRHHTIPDEHVITEILNHLPWSEYDLYGDFCREGDGNVEYVFGDFDTYFDWLTERYPPPKSVELLKKRIETINIKTAENPIKVYNKIQAMFRMVDEVIDIINEIVDQGEELDNLPAPFKFRTLSKCFVENNVNPKDKN